MSDAKAKSHRAKDGVSALARLPLPGSVVGVLNRYQVCLALGGISVRKLTGMISGGRFPRSDIRVGESPRWSVAAVNAWVEAHRDKEAK